jgi:hypothetical protein
VEGDLRAALERRALYTARELGHSIPRIEWDRDGREGSGTCRRCGDGVLLYTGVEGASIAGTAFEFECPGDTCNHGWQIAYEAGRVVLRCLHCGAERREG